jgi:hypothetical protein
MMRVPFTSPNFPELLSLPADDRKALLRKYTGSPEAAHLVRIIKISGFISLMLFLQPIVLMPGPAHLAPGYMCLLSAAGLIGMIGTVVFYRRASRRIILGMMKDPPRGD